MKSMIRTGCGAVLLAFSFAAPLAAGAAATERSYDVQTRIVEQAPSVGESDGSMQLHVSAGGIVSGYYRPDADARFVSVTGGITGDEFWIDIGTFSTHPWHFSGTFNDGKIDAQGSHPVLDGDRYATLELIGKPKAE